MAQALDFAAARARSYWLLDLEVAGTVYRFASESVSVDDMSGETFQYVEGLTDPATSLVQTGAAEATVAITVGSTVDWALIEARGHSLERARGVLRRWWSGTVLEAARVYLRGLSTGIQYGAKGEPLQLSLVRSPRLESDELPDPQAQIGENTWPVTGGYTLPDKSIGSGYPLIIGCPGHDPSATDPRPGVPVRIAEYSAGSSNMLCMLGTMHAAAVRLHDIESGTSSQKTLSTVADDLGRFVSYVSLASATETNEFWIGLQDDATYGGGVPSPFGTGPLRGAGDVIAWALIERSTMRVDAGRIHAHRGWLNQFKVDTYLNKPTNVWDFLTANVLRWLPVTIQESPEGLYVMPLRWDYTLEDVQAYLSVARGDVERAGPITRLRQPVYNEVTVRYRPSNESGNFHTSRTVTAKAGTLSGVTETTADSRISGSFAATRSQAEYKRVLSHTVDIVDTWDDATAELVAELLIDRYAWPKRSVQYSGGRELEALTPGDAVAITDADLHLTDAVAILVDVTPSPGGVLLDLIVLDHPAQRSTATT